MVYCKMMYSTGRRFLVKRFAEARRRSTTCMSPYTLAMLVPVHMAAIYGIHNIVYPVSLAPVVVPTAVPSSLFPLPCSLFLFRFLVLALCCRRSIPLND